MSGAEELLNSGATAYIARPDTEPHIVIGEDRFITVPAELRRIAVQYDHDIETVAFDCPRYWDNHDMSTMKVYINYMLSSRTVGCYPVKDVTVDEIDPDIMHFTWTISGNVTQEKGPLTFLVCIRKADDNGNEVNHWNSELNKEMTISEGMECGEIILPEYPDLIAQWELEIEAVKRILLDARDAGEFNGATFTPSISNDGVLSWTNDKGLPNPTPYIIGGGSGSSVEFSGTEPANGPTIWYDTSSNVMKYKDREGNITEMYPATKKNHVLGLDGVSKGYLTSGDGSAYTVTIDELTSLEVGTSFVMIPHVDSTTLAPTLNVNGLGAVGLRLRMSGGTGDYSTGIRANWVATNRPVWVTYTGEYWVVDVTVPDASTIYGTVDVTHGGTGATTLAKSGYLIGNGAEPVQTRTSAEVREDLNVMAKEELLALLDTLLADKAPMYTKGTEDLEDGVTPLENNRIHFVYSKED